MSCDSMIICEKYVTDDAAILLSPVSEDATAAQLAHLTLQERSHIATFSNPRRRAEWAAWRSAVRNEVGGTMPVATTCGTGNKTNFNSECGETNGTTDDDKNGVSGKAVDKAGDATDYKTIAETAAEAGCCATGELVLGYDATGAPTLGPNSTGWRHIGVSHTRGMAAVILSSQRCAIDIEHTGRDFSRAAAKYVSDAEAAMPEATDALFCAVIWCAKETLYKFAGREGMDFREELRISQIDLPGGTMIGEIRSRSYDSRTDNSATNKIHLPKDSSIGKACSPEEFTIGETFSPENYATGKPKSSKDFPACMAHSSESTVISQTHSPEYQWTAHDMRILRRGDYLIVYMVGR